MRKDRKEYPKTTIEKAPRSGEKTSKDSRKFKIAAGSSGEHRRMKLLGAWEEIIRKNLEVSEVGRQIMDCGTLEEEKETLISAAVMMTSIRAGFRS